jgi:hypothetical protein
MYQKQNLKLSTWNINGYISKGTNSHIAQGTRGESILTPCLLSIIYG